MFELPTQYHIYPQSASEIVYHYCALDSFMKIVEGNSLWLTPIDKMNDYAEGSWLTHIVSDLCKVKLASGIGSLDIFDTLIKNINACIRVKLPYMACFSSQRDLLSQWRGYADGGKGIAIGFERSVLEQSMLDFFQSELPSNPGYSSGLAKVFYSTTADLEPWLSPELDKVTQHNYVDAARGLSEFALLFKNPSFSEENEWRIVAVPKRNLFASGWEIVHPALKVQLRFRPVAKGVSSYFEIPSTNSAIQDVVLGPLNKSETDDVVAFLANKLGRRIQVSRSAATYCE